MNSNSRSSAHLRESPESKFEQTQQKLSKYLQYETAFLLQWQPAMHEYGSGRTVFEHRQDLRDLGLGRRRQPGHRYIEVCHAVARSQALFRYRPLTTFPQIDDRPHTEPGKTLETLTRRLPAAIHPRIDLVEIPNPTGRAGKHRQT